MLTAEERDYLRKRIDAERRERVKKPDPLALVIGPATWVCRVLVKDDGKPRKCASAYTDHGCRCRECRAWKQAQSTA